MHSRVRPFVFAVALAALLPVRAQAQTGLMADLIKDMHDVHGKLVALAKATPEDKMSYRPTADVRSTGEVFLHVASDNYLLPAMVGAAPIPASTGISATDLSTLGKFEKQTKTRDALVSELNTSFGHLAKAMGGVADSRMDEKVKMFGQDMTMRQVWLLTVTHLHEHLGQSIAYARANGITPPWSK
jgi:hypothetical protein